MTKKWKYIIVILLFLISSGSTSIFAQEPGTQSLNLPTEQVNQYTFKNGLFWNKNVQFVNGDTYWFKRFSFQKPSKEKFSFSFFVPGKNGTFRYIERKINADGKMTKEWKTIALSNDVQLPRTYGFIDTDSKHVLVSFPDIYKKGLYNTLTETALSYPLRIQEAENGYKVFIEFSQVPNTIGEIWALESSEPLVDWSRPGMAEIWLLLDLSVEQKWSWDGFYVKTPSSYYPTGSKQYWRLPENYVARSFVITGGSRAADDLGWMMVKTVLPQQNEHGFWPSLPQSNWLKDDYGIEAGFYDTRFNTDMGFIIAKAAAKYQDPSFVLANLRYAEFLLRYCEDHHFIVPGEQEGWLVEDYAHFEKEHLRTHTSLNHQLQEINYFLEMYALTSDVRYQEMANRLLYGVKNTTEHWIQPSGNLYYGYFPSGEMGRQDYPFLTYNDLWLTQHYLLKQTGKLDPDLTRLMESKKSWMDANGVDGYRKEPIR